MPGTPEEEIKTEPTTAGDIEFYTYTSKVGNEEYFVSYNNNPASIIPIGDTTPLLNAAKTGALNEIEGGELLSEREIYLDGNKGKEIIIQLKNEKIKYQLFLVGTRLLQVGAMVPSSAIDSERVNNFFNSFSIDSKIINFESAMQSCEELPRETEELATLYVLCIFGSAKNASETFNSLEECNKLTYIEDYNSCVTGLGIKQNNANICDNITENEEGIISKNNCIYLVAAYTKDVSKCDKILDAQDKADCISDVEAL